MEVIFGAVIVAAAMVYVGRKLGRMLYALVLVLENIGARQYRDWPSDDEIRKHFKG